MRALLVAGLVATLSLAGCMGEGASPAAQDPAASPEAACDARGLNELSCDTFCQLHAIACGLPEPTHAPYPGPIPVPLPTAVAPVPGSATLPNGTANGSAPQTMPAICALVPTLAECPDLP